MDNYNKIKNLTIEQIINLLFELKNNETHTCVRNEIYKCIFASKEIDYKGLYLLLPSLDEDDISFILKYDKDYKISFLLSLVDFADEEDLTKQAIFLLRRHNLNYILPLLPYVDEDVIREEYVKTLKKAS